MIDPRMKGPWKPKISFVGMLNVCHAHTPTLGKLIGKEKCDFVRLFLTKFQCRNHVEFIGIWTVVTVVKEFLKGHFQRDGYWSICHEAKLWACTQGWPTGPFGHLVFVQSALFNWFCKCTRLPFCPCLHRTFWLVLKLYDVIFVQILLLRWRARGAEQSFPGLMFSGIISSNALIQGHTWVATCGFTSTANIPKLIKENR